MLKRHKWRQRVCYCLGIMPIILAASFYNKELYKLYTNNKMQNYLKNDLIPEYGLVEGKDIDELLAEHTKIFYSGKWENCEGIYGARIMDIDGNSKNELLILRYEETEECMEAITEVFYIDAFGKIRAYDCTELEQSVNKTILNERTVVLDIFFAIMETMYMS